MRLTASNAIDEIAVAFLPRRALAAISASGMVIGSARKALIKQKTQPESGRNHRICLD